MNMNSPLEGEVKTESTEMVEGPNGMGGVETVSVSVNGVSSTRGDSTSLSPATENTEAVLRAEGGVTQGELLRQEQRAGVVPIAQLSGHRVDGEGNDEEDEIPHARGPEEIGMEDMGPQNAGSTMDRGGPHMDLQGIDVEAAVGRKKEVKEEVKLEEKEVERPSTPKREAEEELGPDAKRTKEEIPEDTNDQVKDEDTEIKDAEVKNEEETKFIDEAETEDATIEEAETESV